MSCLSTVLTVVVYVLPTTGELSVDIENKDSAPYVRECRAKYSAVHCPRLVIRTIDKKHNLDHTYLICRERDD